MNENTTTTTTATTTTEQQKNKVDKIVVHVPQSKQILIQLSHSKKPNK